MPDRYSLIAPGDKTRVHTRPHFPILFANPYPDSNPNALLGADVYFYKAGEWFVDNKDDIYFINPFNQDTTYFTKIDTQNQYHLMRGQVIVTDLLDEVSYLPVSKGSTDSAYYWPTGIDFKANAKPDAAAGVDFNTGRLEVNINRRKNILVPNIYEIKSIFRHEMLYVREWPTAQANKRKGIEYQYIDYANVYEEQMTYPEFLLVPEDGQINVINQYALRVFNQFCKEGINKNLGTINIEGLKEALDNFNNGTGKLIEAKLELRKKQFRKTNEVAYEISLSFKNKMRQPIQYSKLKNTTD